MKKILYTILMILIISCKENHHKAEMNHSKNVLKFVNQPQDKVHLILPNTFTIQLKDKNGDPVKIENVLCHLNIYSDELSYHTYSLIPTNSEGIVKLSRQQIINNTELKHTYDESIPLDKTPVKFDFFVIKSEVIDIITSSMKKYLSLDIESIKVDMKNQGFSDTQITAQLQIIEEKMKSDKKLYALLKKQRNSDFNYSKREPKITDYWTSETDVAYDITIEK